MGQPDKYGTGTFFTIIEAVLYEYTPYLNRRGAHVWIEEVSLQRFVLGFSCWASDRSALWTWLHDRLRQTLKERVFNAVTVKDLSDLRPSYPRRQAIVAGA